MPQEHINPTKFYIKTYGCQSNIAATEKLAGTLEALGFEETSSLEACTLFIINTCSIRQKSEDKVYGLGKDLKQLKLAKKKPFVVLAGCMVGSTLGERTRYAFSELERKTPWADMYVSPEHFSKLPKLLVDKGLLNSWQQSKLNMLDDAENNVKLSDASHAFVNISSGCDNFCTYCVVPYARGEEVSRSLEEVVKEVSALAKQGVEKVTLCGQNVNSWGLSKDVKFKLRTGGALPDEVGEELPFTMLLKEVHKIENIKEIDFLSSNPFDFTQDLIQALPLPKISDYIHIAVQSGNNDILRKMNRRHTVEEFIELINEIKKVRPDMKFGTDVIVGFPGETREQFMDTVHLFEIVQFTVAYISMYSPRKGTVSEKLMKNDVSLQEKKYRHKYLSDVWKNNR